MKPSELLRKAAEYMDETCEFGCCWALEKAVLLEGISIAPALAYLEMFTPGTYRSYWFGSTRYTSFASPAGDPIHEEVKRNTHERVLCLLLASEVAKSEGN